MIKIAYLCDLSESDRDDLRNTDTYIYFCRSFKQFSRLYSQTSIDALILDYQILNKSVMKKIAAFRFSIKPPIIVAYKNEPLIDEFILLSKTGVDSYILKPLDYKALFRKLKKLMLIPVLEPTLPGSEQYHWPGNSLIMKSLKEDVKRYADSLHNILITGESGCGKGFIAKELHRYSERSDEPFCDINCASIPESLFEAELFGTSSGAFTGSKERAGLLDYSGSGTIFLDEIGEISPFLQVKLLKVIEDRFYYPLGSTRVKQLRSRIIAATNLNLKKCLKKGHFRQDLFYRLNTLSLTIPPLRKHKEDIPHLVDHFLENFNSTKKITHNALKKLYKYDWPGNIRELISTLQRAETLCQDSPWIESIHIRF